MSMMMKNMTPFQCIVGVRLSVLLDRPVVSLSLEKPQVYQALLVPDLYFAKLLIHYCYSK
jgi:hypothetical protein